MADTFTGVTTNAGSGGATIAADPFTDGGSNSRVMPMSALVIGDIGGPYDVVHSGNPFPVLHVGAIPAGANVIGHVITDTGSTTAVTGTVACTQSGTWTVSAHAVTNAGVFVVQENGAALTSLQLIDNLVLAEDAASVSGDPGVQVLAVRKATPANTSGTDGDYEPLQVSAGRLWASVVVDTALPAGTNAIGKLAANDGVDIGDVTVNNAAGVAAVNIQDGGNSITVDGTVAITGSVVIGAGSSIIGHVIIDSGSTTVVTGTVTVSGTATVTGNKAEDAAAADGDSGLPILGVRNDSATARTGTDGDYGMLALDSAGRLGVCDLGGSVSVDDNGGSLTVDGSVAATQSGTWTMQPGNTANTTAWKVDASSVAVPITDNSGSLTVDNGGTFAVQATLAAGAAAIGKAEDVASADADVGVPAMAVRKATPANTSGTDGDYEFLQMSVGRLWVSATIDAALPAGTNGIGKLTANAGVTIGAVEIAAAQTLATITTVSTVTTVSTLTTCSTVTTLTGSAIAHDGVDSGNPHKIGAIATASVLGRTPVAAADRTDIVAGTDGVLLNRPHASLEDIISEQKTNTDGASTAMTSGFAATASQRIYLTTLIISNSSANSITVDIRDGSAGAVLITVPVPSTGGAVINFPIPLRFSANTALAFDGSAAATTLTVSCVGFKSKA